MTADYGARIARARGLQKTYPFAAEILTFYEKVCGVQERIATHFGTKVRVRRDVAGGSGNLRERIDVDLVVPHVRDALNELTAFSPGALRSFFAQYLDSSTVRWAASLQEYVNTAGRERDEGEPREALVARILIEPCAELLAEHHSAKRAGVSGNLCPRCEARPMVGVLRIEGDGGKRFLKCSFCASEWEFRRIYCAYCGEEREQSLPVFVAEEFPHIRVEACDTCRHCVRTVDLTKDGNAVPAVDDLAAIPLGLWAEEHGYERIYGNLLGT